jgi:hypothetical protein
MTELDIYRFITDNGCDYNVLEDDAILFVSHGDLHAFTEMIGKQSMLFDDGGIECMLQPYCVALYMADLCERNELDWREIFTEK